MKIAKHFAVSLAAIMFSAGCSTESQNQDVAGVATVSALVLALPLIPVTLPLSAIREGRQAENDKALYKKLDPVYQKRIEMIKTRSPKADADEAWSENAKAFLPTTFDGDNYLGLENTEYESKNGHENQQQISTNNFLTYLQTLLSDDPLQQQVKMWNDKYNEFLDTRWAYEKQFNTEIYQQLQNSNLADRTTVP